MKDLNSFFQILSHFRILFEILLIMYEESYLHKI